MSVIVRKFFVALLLGLLVISSSIAAAEDVDWDSAPRIGSKAQLVRYIESERRKGHTTFHIVLTNDLKVGNEANRTPFAELVCVPWCTKANVVFSDGINTYMTYEIREYPGTRVANAYLSGNTINLTYEECELYNKAVEIAVEAQKYSNPVDKEWYIYNEIRRRTKFQSHSNENAIGALIIGFTNCQGYSDAFYMLGRMCGLDVMRISGKVLNKYGEWEGHQWNVITFDNGNTYYHVDVSSYNENNPRKYFNATIETISDAIRCDL